MTFAELNLTSPLIRAINDLGFTHPTTIQEKAFPVIMSGRDVLGIAQTGTGKTIAFALPALRQWTFDKNKNPQILIIVPTRELVVQVMDVFKALAAYQNVTVHGVYGGVNMKTQAWDISGGMDVLVATPGRLYDLAVEGHINLKMVKKLILDEVDEMLDLGFRTQISAIFDLLPPKRQNLMFSATLTPEVDALIRNFFNDPVRIEAAPAGTPLDNIAQSAFRVPNFYTKINLLEHLLRQNNDMNKVLVFTATKELANEVFEQLSPMFPDQTDVIHSRKAQNYRFRAVNKFHDGKIRILIATDLISRGIDISQVSHVINFDMPAEPENYIHRIGRTGRADQKGVAISFIVPRDIDKTSAIETLMGQSIPELPFPDEVPVSAILAPSDKEPVPMKNTLTQTPKRDPEHGGAFHQKSDKNRKVNNKIPHKVKMMQKYGKPITKGAKKK